MPATFVKSKTDNVKLVNISDKTQIFGHDGANHTIESGKFLTVSRERAEHGVRKCFSMATNKHALKIEELPEGLRTAEGISKVASQFESEKSEHAETKKLNAQLTEENHKLRQENDRLRKK